MSRTVRRKSLPPGDWVTHDWVAKELGFDIYKYRCKYDREKDKYEYEKIRVPATISVRVHREGKDLAKQLAKYHGDNRSGYWGSCPKFHRVLYNRIHRGKNNAEVKRFMKEEDYEVSILPKPPLPYWD